MIYLPNGGKIRIYTTWKSEHEDNGNILLYANNEAKTFLGVIFSNGCAHLTESCSHTYYPPEITNTEHAADLVIKDLKEIIPFKLKLLKKLLSQFDAKSGIFK